MNSYRGLLSLLLVAGSASPAAAEPFTLRAARAQAIRSRPELAGQDARVEAAKAQVREAKSARRPRFEASVEASLAPGGQLIELGGEEDDIDVGLEEPIFVSGTPALGGAGAFDPQLRYGGLVGVEWSVLDFGRSESATRAARSEARAREAERASAQATLLRAVDGAYLEWLGAFERARFQRSQRAELADRLAAARSDREAGLVSNSELLPMESELAQAELRVAYAEEAEARALTSLGDAAGRPVPAGATPELELLELGGLPEPAPDPDEAEARAVRSRVASAEASRQGRSSEFLPVLGLSAQAGVRGQQGNLFPVYRAQVGLRIPIWDGGGTRARADTAAAEARALEAQREVFSRSAKRAERDRAAALESARRRVGLAERYLEVASERLADTEGRKEAGVASDIERRGARADLDRAQLELLNARLDRAAAALQLR